MTSRTDVAWHWRWTVVLALSVVSSAVAAGPEQDLYRAIRADDAAKVQLALEQLPTDVRFPPAGERLMPVATAAASGAARALRTLLGHERGVNESDRWGRTPLFEATTDEVVTILAEHGADVNASDWLTRRTPLHEAANASVARALVMRGAKLSVQDSDGLTPLDVAVRTGRPETAEALRQLKARHSVTFGITMSGQNGWTEYTKRKGGAKPVFGDPVFVAKLKNYRPTNISTVEVSCDWFDAKGELVGNASEVYRNLRPNEVRFVKLEAFAVPFPAKFAAKAREIEENAAPY